MPPLTKTNIINNSPSTAKHMDAIERDLAISLAPVGTQACVLDIAKFHRTCPVLPDHKCWLVVHGRPGDFYIDHVHPFGTASASSNAGMIANAMVDIWIAEGIKQILKYEDDLSCFRYPPLTAPSPPTMDSVTTTTANPCSNASPHSIFLGTQKKETTNSPRTSPSSASRGT